MNVSPEVEKEVERQFQILKYGTIEITPEEDFKAMLRESILKNRPLRVKCGIDPTNVDVHLGHLVPYRKMRLFQDLGHKGVVIIGDYTAQIGDPTGKIESRPHLSSEQVRENAKNYMEQVYTVLDPQKTEIRYQSEWFNDVGLKDVIKWCAQTTVAKLISHDTFKTRLEKGTPLGLHEFLYPVLQGVDSVYVESDVELGGSDQKFNVLMGRDFQKNANLRPQVAMLLPIITGLDGVQKMSKSLANYIAVWDEPFNKFGKVMSIPDNLMVQYFQFVANLNEADVKKMEADINSNAIHPNEAKKQLATKVVALFHGEDVAKKMREQFESVFAKGNIPDDVDEVTYTLNKTLIDLLGEANVLPSKSEIKRMFVQNAVTIVDGDKLTDPQLKLDAAFNGKVIKIGKRKFLRLKLGN